MTSRTAWVGGNGAGIGSSPYYPSTLINSSDLVSMANGKTVLSTVADIDNGANLDQFMDVSVRLAIASNTIALGANVVLWLYYLLDDGSTYGDGQLTAGTQSSVTPTFESCCSIPLVVAASQTLLVGNNRSPIMLLPGKFRGALQQNSGFTLTSGTQVVKFRTYNQNLNN